MRAAAEFARGADCALPVRPDGVLDLGSTGVLPEVPAVTGVLLLGCIGSALRIRAADWLSAAAGRGVPHIPQKFALSSL